MQQILNQWINNLPKTTAMIRVRLGGETSRLSTVGTIAIIGRGYNGSDSEFEPIECELEDVVDQLVDLMSDNGWETDHKCARIHACSKAGKQIRSKSLTASKGRAQEISGAERALEKMTDGIISLSMEMRRSLGVLSDALAHREQVTADSIDQAIQSRWGELESDSYATLLEQIQRMEDVSSNNQDDTVKEQAGLALTKVLSMFGSPQPNPHELIREWIKNPEFVRDVMSDPDIQEQILRAYRDQASDFESQSETTVSNDNATE
tara:strand:- start:175 stop:966 length:792 start_codon:yes stop_codon:yes gene_type:complete